jgi:hypothetical protein
MGDGRTDVVLLWETRAMSEQNLLVSAGSAPAPNRYKYLVYGTVHKVGLFVPLQERLYPTGEEFREYLYDISAKYNLDQHIQLNTDVTEMRWTEDDAQWEVELQHLVPSAGDLSTRDREEKSRKSGRESIFLRKEIVRAKAVVSCVDILVEPNAWRSSIPGRDTLKGDIFH